MDDGKICLIGGESDTLHCGYSYAIKDNGKRYPSIAHYTHSMILSQLNIPESVILDLLCVPSNEVQSKAYQLLEENMPTGYDMESLSKYLQDSKSSYTMMGLNLRLTQDKAFEKTLLDTKDTLLIVCDPNDRELGIGMDEPRFIEWMKREKVDSNIISYWFKNDSLRHHALGQNRLGYYLMWVRRGVKDAKQAEMLGKHATEVNGLSIDEDDKPVRIKVNDLVITLQGIFRPLSNYFPLPVTIKNDSYRSVEHYVYEKLFIALKLDDVAVEKLQTCVNPLDVAKVSKRVIQKLNIDQEEVQSKLSKMDRWRQSAMKKKFHQYNHLAQLLLSTGNAILIDCSGGDPTWCSRSSESELQHLLTKKYVTSAGIINWMIDKDEKDSKAIQHLRGNKTGLLLMELRERFANKSTIDRIPLISPITTSLSTISQHMICFTAESVFHPFYSAEVFIDGKAVPSPAHFVALQAVNFFPFNSEDREYVLEPDLTALETWERLHETIEYRGRVMDREQSWYMERRQKAIYDGIKLLLEHHPGVLRALLDTGDALLVYCARFSSMESELSIGMRERDLRLWCNICGLGTDKLLELSLLPLAFRPAYLGGNRLGVILMQLRREFTLRGVFPQSLPELPLTPEQILGTESPTESMIASELFDPLDAANYSKIFINPLYLLIKTSPELDILKIASSKKRAPRFVTVDIERINEIVELVESKKKWIKAKDLSAYEADDLRAVFMQLSDKLKKKLMNVDKQHGRMSILSQEVTKMQSIRRNLEETRDRSLGRAAGGKERIVPERKRERSPPKRIYNDTEFKIPKRTRSPIDRYNKRDDAREKRNRSPLPYRRDREERDRLREKEREIKERPRSPPRKRKEPTPPPIPKIPKVVRPPDAELSEGEILSSDED